MQKCIGQVLLDVIQRCNETSSICDKLRIDNHDVVFNSNEGITVSFRGSRVDAPDQKFRLGLFIHFEYEGHIPEDILYEEVLRELQKLREDIP